MGEEFIRYEMLSVLTRHFFAGLPSKVKPDRAPWKMKTFNFGIFVDLTFTLEKLKTMTHSLSSQKRKIFPENALHRGDFQRPLKTSSLHLNSEIRLFGKVYFPIPLTDPERKI